MIGEQLKVLELRAKGVHDASSEEQDIPAPHGYMPNGAPREVVHFFRRNMEEATAFQHIDEPSGVFVGVHGEVTSRGVESEEQEPIIAPLKAGGVREQDTAGDVLAPFKRRLHLH